MGISAYLKEIGRGAQGARALSREQAADLMGQVLDGQCTDLELGAFCIAMRVKGETPAEMAGFLDAVDTRITKLPNRKGDNAPMALIELVLEPVAPKKKAAAPKAAPKKAAKVEEAAPVDEVVEETAEVADDAAAEDVAEAAAEVAEDAADEAVEAADEK